MKKLLILLSVCISIPAFASQITNTYPWYYTVCTTADGGVSWKDAGTLNPDSTMDFDGTADAVAIGRIGDCDYKGNSWNNHAADVNIGNWIYNPPAVAFNVQGGAAMIFWQNNPFTHVTTNIGLDSLWIIAGMVSPYDQTKKKY